MKGKHQGHYSYGCSCVEKRIQELKKALAFYANSRNWGVNVAGTLNVTRHRLPEAITPAEADAGQRAKKVLARKLWNER